MALVSLEDIVLDYPVVSPEHYSLKKTALSFLKPTGPNRVTTIRALDRISLKTGPGSRIGLYGPNGSGKSTLLRVIAGIYPPTRGHRVVEGRMSILLGLGAGSNGEMAAETNIRMLLRIEGVEPAPELVDEIWAFTEIEDGFRKMPLRSFSSGMQLRVLFAVATAIRKDILLLDEWLSVADAHFTEKAQRRLIELVDAAKILFLASHDRRLLESVCSQVINLEHGRIASIDPN
jgi:lipopolysaccharide transport system ATP-binding protein